MPEKRPRLAKLTRPRLYRAVARERLFALLDEKREHPMVWIAGPPGAGKTTLAASYIEQAGIPAIWYQVDSGDSDPATFFLYLKQAVEGVSRHRRKSLPLLTPEYLPDLAGFARRFMRNAFQMLAAEAILVFDNYHEMASDSPLHAAIAGALAEIPRGVNVIVVSRSSAPPPYAGMVLNAQVADIGWADLRLTRQETTEIAHVRGVKGTALTEALHERSGGWIAGVVLIAERGIAESGKAAKISHLSLETIFDYFASLVFGDANVEVRETLVRASLLPYVTSHALEAICGTASVMKHIESLHRRHLFTDRIPATESAYRFHALFRAFLQSRAREILSDDQQKAVFEGAARAFEEDGVTEEAFALNVNAMQWAKVEQQYIDLAPRLISQGRWQTLQDWSAMIPETRMRANPWLSYWQGLALIAVDPSTAKDMLTRTYERFAEFGDGVGQLLCSSATIEALYYEFDDFHPMDAWLTRVVELISGNTRPRTIEEELAVYRSIVIAGVSRSPGHAMLLRAVERVIASMDRVLDENLKLAAATVLIFYSNLSMDERVTKVAQNAARPLLNSPSIAPIRATFYLTSEGFWHYLTGNYQEAMNCFDSTDRIAASNGLVHSTKNFEIWRAVCERRMGRLDAAESTLERIGVNRKTGDGYFGPMYDYACAVVAFDRGNTDKAVALSLSASRAFDVGGQANASTMVRVNYAYMLIALGRLGEAEGLLDECRRYVTGTAFDNIIGAIALNQAWHAQKKGAIGECETLLAEALREAAKSGSRARLRWYPQALEALLPFALEKGMDSTVVADLIRECEIRPPERFSQSWPWPVKILVLGNFELRLHGSIPAYSRKLPKKPLSLLKAIIAFGAVEVPERKLASALWPDEEGDAAHHMFTATLHRLRKLLGSVTSIRQVGGALTLDPQSCWVDALAFERCLDDRETREDHKAAIDLYRGPFLAQDEDEPWATPTRERLRTKFIQSIEKQARMLEASNQWEGAVLLHLRGIDADPLIEDFYRGLMRCYDKLGRRTEAAGVFRRLRQTLSVTLGIQPSVASQRMFESLRSDGA